MTAEMGPRDDEVSFRHQLGGISIKAAVALINATSDDTHARYDRVKGRLTFSGESEHAGDRFARGRHVSGLTSVAMLLPLLLMMLSFVLGPLTQAGFGAAVAAVPMALSLILNIVALINALALIGLTQQISVVDHTTEPTPDALDDLQRQYVDGEIDEQELDERAAEVWER